MTPQQGSQTGEFSWPEKRAPFPGWGGADLARHAYASLQVFETKENTNLWSICEPRPRPTSTTGINQFASAKKPSLCF